MANLLNFFNLKEKPFSLLPNPRFLYLSEPYLETKSKLLYFLKDRTASLYLYGEIGCGKTSTTRLLAQEIESDKSIVSRYIVASPNQLRTNQFIRKICDEFKINTARSQQESQKRFEKYLIDNAKNNRLILVMIDEAQVLSKDQLKLIHYYLNFTSNEQVLIMFVLVGQPLLADKIGKLPSLKSRLISASLSGMTRVDMESMVKFRWNVAQGASSGHFPLQKEALDYLYRLTKGNCREVVKLCHGSLLQAYLRKSQNITVTDLKKASKEL